MMLEDPRARLLFSKILNEAGGVSPVELSSVSAGQKSQPTQQEQQPIQQPTQNNQQMIR